MPLTVPMSCGFDADSLMDFDCGPSAVGVCWPTSGADFDADPLLMVSLQSTDNKGDNDQSGTGLLKDAAFNNETDASSGGGGGGWCAKSKSSTGSGNSSSYCRRLGSSQRARSGSSFQLWSPRLKQRDERKRVLKMSLAKLRRIDDAESCLRRSVLLNNTLRRLQREVRDEKANAMDRLQHHHHHQQQQWHQQHQQPEADYVVVDSRLEHPAAPVRLDPLAKSLLSCDELPSLSEEMDEDENSLSTSNTATNATTTTTTSKPAAIKRRRSASSEDDDVSALSLNELYLPPPTPRLISSLDAADDDVVDVVSEDALDSWSSSYKKAKLADHQAAEVGASDVAPRSRPALRPCNGLPASPAAQQAPVASPASPYSSANQNATPTLVSGYASPSSSSPSPQTPYSCGQSSLFGELQSVVFHSLITSLES